jgi:hypothetical protein
MVSTHQLLAIPYRPSAVRLRMMSRRLHSVRQLLHTSALQLTTSDIEDLADELNQLYAFLHNWWEAMGDRAATHADGWGMKQANEVAFVDWLIVAEAFVSITGPTHSLDATFLEYLEERRAARELASRPKPTVDERNQFLAGGQPPPPSWFDEQWPDLP